MSPPITRREQCLTTGATRAARLAAARQRLAELLDADTYDCTTLHTAARAFLNKDHAA